MPTNVDSERIERAMRSTGLTVSDLQVQAVVAEVEAIVQERLSATTERPRVGSNVRVTADEYPELVGVTGTLTKFAPDGATAWVETTAPYGAWCSVANLTVVGGR